jgi:tetratricopeptide (TPR) repeat protein
MAEGEFALVRQHLEAAIKKPSGTGTLGCFDHHLYTMLADAAAQQRDEAALRHYVPLAEEAAAHYGHKLFQAKVQRAWGVAYRLAGEYAEAEARLNQALALFRELDTPWQIGRTLFELGDLAQTREDVAGAQAHFSQALTIFEEMGAMPDVARIRAALKVLGGGSL